MHTQEHFNETTKSVAAFVTSVLTGLGAYMGLPEYLSPEVISAATSAIMAVAGVFYMVKRMAKPAAEDTAA